MDVSITTASDVAPAPQSPPIDSIPIMLTVHLLGLVIAIAMTIGLIPAAIMLLRAYL